jgi:ParB/RepB/Spo0J family partition protein
MPNGVSVKSPTEDKAAAPITRPAKENVSPDGLQVAKPQKNGTINARANGTQATTGDAPAWQVVWLPVAQIAPNPFQPRRQFDAQEMAELAASVRAHGVLQPITVRTLTEDASSSAQSDETGQAKTLAKQIQVRYHLVSGERRLRACREARRQLIPAIVRDDLSDAAVAELALVENVQRSNLNVIEEASGYKRLMLEFRLKEERLAKKVGKSVQTIKDLIKLLALPQEVQMLIAGKQLTASHGQHLLKIATFESVCTQVARYAVQNKVTATSLETTLLPNARALKEKKLLVELGHTTNFDWKQECGNCPHKAYIASGYGSYCLRPDEWLKKQDAALLRQQQEAARVMEQARQDGQAVVEVEKLPSGAYRNLSFVNSLPAGCSGACPCRGEAADPRDPTQRIPICLQPERFQELVRVEREVREVTRQRHYEAQWKDALAALQRESAGGQPRKSTWLLARPLLQPFHRHFTPSRLNADAWPPLLQAVADELGLELPVAELAALADAEETAISSLLELLGRIEPNRLLLFTAGLQLALDAQNGAHFGIECEGLDLVLERCTTLQPELSDEDGEEDEEESSLPPECDMAEESHDEI